MILIGVAGPARAGKDSIAARLVAQWGFTRYGLADPLKGMLRAGFGLSCQQLEGSEKETPLPWLGKSPRQLLQTLGTEWGREQVHPELWLRLAHQRMIEERVLVVPDVQFENEAKWVRAHGVLWHVRRDNAEQVAAHVSEGGIEVQPEDVVLTNNSDLLALHELVDECLDHTLVRMARLGRLGGCSGE